VASTRPVQIRKKLARVVRVPLDEDSQTCYFGDLADTREPERVQDPVEVIERALKARFRVRSERGHRFLGNHRCVSSAQTVLPAGENTKPQAADTDSRRRRPRPPLASKSPLSRSASGSVPMTGFSGDVSVTSMRSVSPSR